MRWFLEPFQGNEFMIRALVAGLLVALTCAVAGTFVVLRGLAFIGDALAHGVLPGVAGALIVGAPGLLGAVVGATVMIAGVNLVTARSRLSHDTAIALLFVGMLALGVVLVSRSDSFTGDIVRILFGEILGVSRQALWGQAAAALAVGLVALVFARPFLLLAVDPELATVSGYPARRYHVVMLALVAATVIVSFHTVGTILVFGMLVAPSAAGALLARRVGSMMAWSAVLGSVSVYVGLLLSYHLGYAAGATIVLVAVVLFFVVLAGTSLRSGARP